MMYNDLSDRNDCDPIVTYLDYLKATEMMSTELYQYNLFTEWEDLTPLETCKALGLDTETTGLDPFIHRLRLVQVYLPNIDQVAILDLWNLTTDQTIWFNKLLEVLADPNVVKYLQRSLFDLLWFRVKFGISIRNIIDSLVLSQIDKAGQLDSYIFNANIPNPNSLKWLCQEYGYYHDKDYQDSDWSDPNLSKDQIEYAGRDAVLTYLIGRRLNGKLSVYQPHTVESELGCLAAFTELNYQCLPVGDINRLFQLWSAYQRSSLMLEKNLSTLLPEDPCRRQKIDEYWKNPKLGKKGQPIQIPKPQPFNVNSPKQIKEYLIQKFGREAVEVYDKATGETSESTGKEILFEIFTKHPEATEVKDIIYYRGVAKAASTLESYYNSYDPFRKCLQVSYQSLASQGMGRSSSGDKRRKNIQNAQNFSKYLPSHSVLGLPPVRSFVAPRQGYKLLEIDLAASHLQFARVLSEDNSLNKAKQSGIKVHYFTLASMLEFEGLKVTPEECIDLVKGKSQPSKKDHYEHLYKLAKTVIYSFLNYSGANRLQSTFFGYELFVSVDDCRNYLNACAKQYKDLRNFQDHVYNLAEQTVETVYVHNQVTKEQISLGKMGYSVTCDGSKVWHRCQSYQDSRGYWQHKLKISDVVSVQWMRPEGTVMKAALRDIHDLCLDEWGLHNARLVNFSHDSIMLEIKEDMLPVVSPVCCDIITNNMRVYIPDYEPEETWEEQIIKYNWAKYNWDNYTVKLAG